MATATATAHTSEPTPAAEGLGKHSIIVVTGISVDVSLARNPSVRIFGLNDIWMLRQRSPKVVIYSREDLTHPFVVKVEAELRVLRSRGVPVADREVAHSCDLEKEILRALAGDFIGNGGNGSNRTASSSTLYSSIPSSPRATAERLSHGVERGDSGFYATPLRGHAVSIPPMEDDGSSGNGPAEPVQTTATDPSEPDLKMPFVRYHYEATCGNIDQLLKLIHAKHPNVTRAEMGTLVWLARKWYEKNKPDVVARVVAKLEGAGLQMSRRYKKIADDLSGSNPGSDSVTAAGVNPTQSSDIEQAIRETVTQPTSREIITDNFEQTLGDPKALLPFLHAAYPEISTVEQVGPHLGNAVNWLRRHKPEVLDRVEAELIATGLPLKLWCKAFQSRFAKPSVEPVTTKVDGGSPDPTVETGDTSVAASKEVAVPVVIPTQVVSVTGSQQLSEAIRAVGTVRLAFQGFSETARRHREEADTSAEQLRQLAEAIQALAALASETCK